MSRRDPTSTNAPISEPQPGLGAAIRELREERRATEQDVADAAGITTAQLGTVETGDPDPPWPTVRRIADALGVSVTEIAERSEANEREKSPGCSTQIGAG